MSDIFISYAKEDREWVVSLADALRQQGWTVWWDRSIPFGQSFQEVIERELNEAQCAIVVWSRHSVDSGWVSAEADEARNRNIMVPVLIDDASPPLVFRQLQTANLKDWDNDTNSPIFKKLVSDIAILLGQPVTESRFSQPTSQPTQPTAVEKEPHKWLWATGLAGALAVAAFLFSNSQEPAPAESPVINEFRVDNPRINTGDTSYLIWDTSNASSVVIRELGDVAHSGSSRIRPGKTSVYTLIAKNSHGETIQKTVEVIVEEQQKEEKAEEKTPDPNMLIAMFNESFEEGRLDLAEQFLEKVIKMTPDHPEVLKIKDQLETEKKAQQLAEETRQKEQKLTEQEALRQEEARILEQKLAEQRQQEEEERIAEEKKMKEEADLEREAERLREERLQQEEMEKARIAEIKKQEEAERLKNDELQHQQQAQKLADQKRVKEEEIRKKAEQEKARKAEELRLAEIENQKIIAADQLQKEREQQEKVAAAERRIEEEKQRQQELEKQKALATPAAIAVEVKGVDKKFKRYGLLESTLRESVAQQLQAAGFSVVSIAEAKNNKDSVLMQLRFKYIERNYGAGELYTYSATTYIYPASSTKGEALWKQRVESMANILELGKVNKEFAGNVEKFIRDHPGKGLEFKN